MTSNRIQKLLFSEYSDFEDVVLVESPFAETTREGRGIRQVQIGLTPTKLVLATDIIGNASDYPIEFFPGCIDAEIECLELISIFPIELVSLSVFRRRRRKVLKAKFHDGNPDRNCKVVYFELGGSDKRKMFWNLWCERVRFLSPEDKGGSSLTETSVASSTSASSLCVARTRVSNDKIWQYYAGGKDPNGNRQSRKSGLRWTDKDLFFGDKAETISYKMEPVSCSALLQNDADEIRTLYRRRRFQISRSSLSSHLSKDVVGSRNRRKAEHINRFGEGVDEGCETGLYLPAVDCSKRSVDEQRSTDSVSPAAKTKTSPGIFKKLCEEGVEIWETSSKKMKNNRHPRRYGFTALSDLNFCFGEYFSGRGDSYSIQVKESVSSISVYEEKPAEPEFEKATNRFHLCNSPSHESFRPWGVHNDSNRFQVVFWTPDCWFRPSSLKSAYRENRVYLRKIRLFLSKKWSRSNVGMSKKIRFMNFGRFLRSSKIFHINSEESFAEMRKRLKIEDPVSVWDVDSSALAFQITMIDSRLFLKILSSELELLLIHKNGKTSLDLTNWLLFAERISCLVATEILRTDDVKFRARLISRFVNAAEKCHLLHNFQSCRSLLTGLQSPAVYRLKDTWSQVRNHHATKYQTFEKLCRLYRDPRLTCYQRSFRRAALGQPYLPSAVHILSILVGRIFNQPLSSSWSFTSFSQSSNLPGCKKMTIVEQCRANRKNSVPKILKQILSALKIYPSEKSDKSEGSEIRLELNGSSSESRSFYPRPGNRSSNNGINFEVKSFFQPVGKKEYFSNGLEDAKEFLQNGQKAAKKYDLGENGIAKDFLLKVPYRDHKSNYIASFRIEPD